MFCQTFDTTLQPSADRTAVIQFDQCNLMLGTGQFKPYNIIDIAQ